MYVKVRIKFLDGDVANIKVDLPSDLKDFNHDTLDDAVSDYLDDNATECKWFRIIEPPTQ